MDEVDQPLVHLARQHHLHDVGGLGVGDAKSVHELRLLAELAEHLGDLGPAAVHEDDLDPDEGKEHQIPHHGAFQSLVRHGGAAVFDKEYLAAVFAYVRESLDEHLRPLFVVYAHNSSFKSCNLR